MKVHISHELLTASRGQLVLALVTATVKVEQKNDDLWAQLQHCGTIQQNKYPNKDAIRNTPQVNAIREAYKNLGLKSEYKGSNEALLQRVADGKGLYQINNVVDINNLISLESLRSVGSYDLANLAGDIVFRAGTKGEIYTGTTKRPLNLENMPLLADDNGPFGSPTSDSDRALISIITKQIMGVIFSFDGDEQLGEQTAIMGTLLKKYASATNVNTYLVRAEPQYLILEEEGVGTK